MDWRENVEHYCRICMYLMNLYLFDKQQRGFLVFVALSLWRYGGPVDADLQVCDHAIRQSCSHHATFPSSSQSVAGSDWFTEVCAALPLLSCHVCLVMSVWCVNGAHRQAGSRILDTRIYTPPPVTHVNLDPAWDARPQQLITYVH